MTPETADAIIQAVEGLAEKRRILNEKRDASNQAYAESRTAEDEVYAATVRLDQLVATA